MSRISRDLDPSNRLFGASLSAAIVVSLLSLGTSAFGKEPTTISGLKNPESVVVGADRRIYVTMLGEMGKSGDGSVVIVDSSGKITPFASGMDDPKGIISVGDSLYVADVTKVWKVDARGKAEVFIPASAFPRPPRSLIDLAYDGQGNYYVSDSGDGAGKQGAVFRFNTKKQVSLVLDGELTSPQVAVPNGLLVDDPEHLLVADFGLGFLYRFDLVTGNAQRLGGGFGGTDGLARDGRGGLFVSDWKNGRLFQVSSELEPPRLISTKFQSAADIALTPDGRRSIRSML